LVPLLEFNQSTISLKKAGLVYELPAIDTYAKYRANVTPAFDDPRRDWWFTAWLSRQLLRSSR